MLEFVVFGIIDNSIMLLGAFWGLSIERFLPKRFQNGYGAIVGAGVSNAFSDFLGGAFQLNWNVAFGTFIGCTIALLFIPIIAKFKRPKE